MCPAGNGDNLPARHDLVVGVVVRAHVVVVGQLHLVVVEIEMRRVLVGDVPGDRCSRDISIRRGTARRILDVDCEGSAELASLIILCLRGSGVAGEGFGIGSVDVHHRGIVAGSLQYGIRRGGAYLRGLQHPFLYLVLVAGIARDPPGRQLAVAVEHVAEELEALQEAGLRRQGAVVDINIIPLDV